MDVETSLETLKSSTSNPKTTVATMSLQDAINLGEYFPDKLSIYPEWHTLSKHSQLQLIRKALDNRENQLRMQWAEICNVLNFSKKPHLKEALRNIEDQIHKLGADREKLYLEYTKP